MLKIGEKLPSEIVDLMFETQNMPLSLSSFPGQKILLYFYPKDDTPGCTLESCQLRDIQELLSQNSIVLLGCSVDNQKSHQKFAKKHELNFPMIADIDRTLVEAFGVWVEKQMMGKKYMGIQRSTFVIDREMKIENVWEKVNPALHQREIKEYFGI